MAKTLRIQTEGKVRTIWLHRPEARNAFNPAMIEELMEAAAEVADNPAISLVILRGTNHQFCSGADIRWMQQSGEKTTAESHAESQKIADLLEAILTIPVPTIAIAEGAVFGGAMGLLAVCDWVLADPGCRFGFPEVHLGIIPAVIWPFILMKMNPGQALQKALTGETFGFQEAISLHLADALPDKTLEKSLTMLVERIIAKPSPEAQKEIKFLTRKLQQKPSEGVIKETIEILSKLKRSENGQEGMQAFIEKRKPEWK